MRVYREDSREVELLRKDGSLMWAALSKGLLSQVNKKEKVDQAPAILFASWQQVQCDSHFCPVPSRCHEPWPSNYKPKQTFSSSSGFSSYSNQQQVAGHVHMTTLNDAQPFPFTISCVFLWGLRCFWGCAAKAVGKGGHPRWKGDKEWYTHHPELLLWTLVCEWVTATGKWSDLAGMRPT